MSDGHSSGDVGAEPVRRPLPKTKTLAESLRRGAVHTPADRLGAYSQDEAFAALKGYAESVKARLRQLRELFDGEDIDPTTNPEFKKFVSDQLATYTMYYAVSGRLPSEMSQLSEDIAKMMGVVTNDGFDDTPAGLDPALASNVAARAAWDAGLDLTDASMDDMELPRGE